MGGVESPTPPQGRGELRRELARCLRTGRAKRRPRGRGENAGQIRDMVMISDRPAEAEDRAVPGHWEGDLIIGKGCKSAVGTPQAPLSAETVPITQICVYHADAATPCRPAQIGGDARHLTSRGQSRSVRPVCP